MLSWPGVAWVEPLLFAANPHSCSTAMARNDLWAWPFPTDVFQMLSLVDTSQISRGCLSLLNSRSVAASYSLKMIYVGLLDTGVAGCLISFVIYIREPFLL